MTTSARPYRRRLAAWICAGAVFLGLAAMYVHCQFTQRRVGYVNSTGMAVRRSYGWPFVCLERESKPLRSFFVASPEENRVWHPSALAANSLSCLTLALCTSVVVFRIVQRIKWPPNYRLLSLGEFVLATAVVLAMLRIQPELKGLSQSLGLEPGYPLYLGNLYQAITVFACGCMAYVFARLPLTLVRRFLPALFPRRETGKL